jgi:hypothetical protein
MTPSGLKTQCNQKFTPYTHVAPVHPLTDVCDWPSTAPFGTLFRFERCVGQYYPSSEEREPCPPHLSPPHTPEHSQLYREYAKIENLSKLSPRKMTECWIARGIAIDKLKPQDVTDEAILDLYDTATLEEDTMEDLSSMIQGITVKTDYKGAIWHVEVAREDSSEVGELLNRIQKVLPVLKWKPCYLGDGIQCLHGRHPEKDPLAIILENNNFTTALNTLELTKLFAAEWTGVKKAPEPDHISITSTTSCSIRTILHMWSDDKVKRTMALVQPGNNYLRLSALDPNNKAKADFTIRAADPLLNTCDVCKKCFVDVSHSNSKSCDHWTEPAFNNKLLKVTCAGVQNRRLTQGAAKKSGIGIMAFYTHMLYINATEATEEQLNVFMDKRKGEVMIEPINCQQFEERLQACQSCGIEHKGDCEVPVVVVSEEVLREARILESRRLKAKCQRELEKNAQGAGQVGLERRDDDFVEFMAIRDGGIEAWLGICYLYMIYGVCKAWLEGSCNHESHPNISADGRAPTPPDGNHTILLQHWECHRDRKHCRDMREPCFLLHPHIKFTELRQLVLKENPGLSKDEVTKETIERFHLLNSSYLDENLKKGSMLLLDKTCRDWHKNGSCRHKALCGFANQEQRREQRGRKKKASRPVAKLCHFYVAGACKAGAQCNFMHVDPEVTTNKCSTAFLATNSLLLMRLTLCMSLRFTSQSGRKGRSSPCGQPQGRGYEQPSPGAAYLRCKHGSFLEPPLLGRQAPSPGQQLGDNQRGFKQHGGRGTSGPRGQPQRRAFEQPSPGAAHLRCKHGSFFEPQLPGRQAPSPGQQRRDHHRGFQQHGNGQPHGRVIEQSSTGAAHPRFKHGSFLKLQLPIQQAPSPGQQRRDYHRGARHQGGRGSSDSNVRPKGVVIEQPRPGAAHPRFEHGGFLKPQLPSRRGDYRGKRAAPAPSTRASLDLGPSEKHKIQEETGGGPPRNGEQEEERFQFFIRDLQGHSIVMETNINSTVKNIKQQLEATQGTPTVQQRLIFRGKFLQDHHTAAESGLTKAVTVNLVLRLRGGPGVLEEQKDSDCNVADNGGLGDSVRIATLNVNRNFGSKIEQVLAYLVMNDIDVGILQETGVGVMMMEACSKYGFVPYATELENAGVVILVRHDWDFAVTGQPEIIEEGRAIAIRISTGNRQMVIVGLYHPSGLDNFGEDTKEVKRSVKNIEKAISYYNHTTQLLVVAGDFNDTSMAEDRIRPKGVATKAIGKGHTINPLLDAHFTDSHEFGDMTCFRHTLGKKLTRSRIDRIFFKTGSNTHAAVVSRRTQRVVFTKNGTTEKEERGRTDHALVITEISTTALPTAPEHTKERSTRLVFKNATDDEKTSFAEAIGTYFGVQKRRILGEISNKDMDTSDQAIADIATDTQNIAAKHFKRPDGKADRQERGTLLRIKHLNAVIRAINYLKKQNLAEPTTNQAKIRFKRIVSKLPAFLKKGETPVNSTEGEKWLALLRTERNNKVTKMRLDRDVKKHKQMSKLNPMEEALKIIREESHQDIASFIVVEEKTNRVVTEPSEVKKGLVTHLKEQTGFEGQSEPHWPEWMEEEMRETMDYEYSLDRPFTKAELRAMLMKGEADSSPGKDGLQFGLLKMAIKWAPKGEESLLEILLAAAQAIYDEGGRHKVTKEAICRPIYKSQGNKQLDNIRPISLQNALAKIPSKLLADRLTSDLLRNGALHKANEGFLRNRETNFAIKTVLNLWEDANEQGRSNFGVALDVSKAFDRLRWFTIKNGMNRIGLPKKFQEYVLGKMKDSTMAIKTAYGLTEPFEIKTGTPQGCPLSPLLYIIAMDMIHKGLETNPLAQHKGASDGLAITGTKEKIGDKCYADDTLVMARTLKGLHRMMDWVNAFCAHNYISMNFKKTVAFGMDELGQDVPFTIKVIQHQRERQPTYNVVVSKPGNESFKYLGVYINIKLDWKYQVGKLNQIVGWYRHIMHNNRMSAEAAKYVINSILRPKLEYRMGIVPLDKKTVQKWDANLQWTMSYKINQREGVIIKRQILETVLGVQFPSSYINQTKISNLQVIANNTGTVGTTTRARLGQGDPYDSINNQSQTVQKLAKKKYNLSLNENIPNAQLPKNLSAACKTYPVEIQGVTFHLPREHWGTWGEDQQPMTVEVFTDGSRAKEKADEDFSPQNTTAAWAAILVDEGFEKHWEALHEDQGRKCRLDALRDMGTPYWGGALPGSPSSYDTELNAIVRMAMILPSSWKVQIYTDSKSSIDSTEKYDPWMSTRRICSRAGWRLLKLYHEINKQRKIPIELVHVKAHQQLHDRCSVGNATADLMADQARLFGTVWDIPVENFDYAYTFFGKSSEGAPGNLKDLKKMLQKKYQDQSNRKAKWETSTQGRFMREGFEPEKTLKYFKKHLKGQHLGSLCEVVAGTLEKATYVHSQPPTCRYCKMKRGKIYETTAQHFQWCTTNKAAKTSLKNKIEHEIVSKWVPQWTFPTQEGDTTIRMATHLVDELNCTKTFGKIAVETEMGCLGHIWPSDLDKLATMYVKNATDKGEMKTFTKATWTQHLMGMLKSLDCGCISNCGARCRHKTQWSPPKTLQALAHVMIGADTLADGTCLTKSSCLKYYTSEGKAEQAWGACRDEDPKVRNTNYFYAPEMRRQNGALSRAAERKKDGSVEKSLGLVYLTPETEKLIETLKLTIVARLPARTVWFTQPPGAKKPKKSGTIASEMALVLAVAEHAQTDSHKEILRPINCLKQWCKEFCTTAKIKTRECVRELSGSQEVNGDDEEEWQRIILEAWQWTASDTGNMGILLQQDMDKIITLGGSRRYNDSAKEVALWLFCRFARDSEDKKSLTPIEHKWAKRKSKRKGTGKAVKAKVVDKDNEQVLEAVVLTRTTIQEPEKAGDLTRRELQELAKRHNIKANQKSKDIVQQLKELGNTPPTDHTVLQKTISDTAMSGGEPQQEDRGTHWPMEIDWEQEQESKHSHGPLSSQTLTKRHGEKKKGQSKIKDQQKIAAEKRKQQKQNREEEENTEKAKRVERRRESEEGRLARRNRRDRTNIAYELSQSKSILPWTISDTEMSGEESQEEDRGIQPNIVWEQEEQESKHSHESQSSPERAENREEEQNTEKAEKIETRRKREEGRIARINRRDSYESQSNQGKQKGKRKNVLIISNRCS